jgi:hypothetical protein
MSVIDFKPEMRPVEVSVLTGENWIDGEWSPGHIDSTVTDSMAPIPITPAQLKNLPEGAYTAGDMKFYAVGKQYKRNDIICHNDIKYTIRDIMDRTDHGDYVIYYSRRLYEQDSTGT